MRAWRLAVVLPGILSSTTGMGWNLPFSRAPANGAEFLDPGSGSCHVLEKDDSGGKAVEGEIPGMPPIRLDKTGGLSGAYVAVALLEERLSAYCRKKPEARCDSRARQPLSVLDAGLSSVAGSRPGQGHLWDQSLERVLKGALGQGGLAPESCAPFFPRESDGAPWAATAPPDAYAEAIGAAKSVFSRLKRPEDSAAEACAQASYLKRSLGGMIPYTATQVARILADPGIAPDLALALILFPEKCGRLRIAFPVPWRIGTFASDQPARLLETLRAQILARRRPVGASYCYLYDNPACGDPGTRDPKGECKCLIAQDVAITGIRSVCCGKGDACHGPGQLQFRIYDPLPQSPLRKVGGWTEADPLLSRIADYQRGYVKNHAAEVGLHWLEEERF